MNCSRLCPPHWGKYLQQWREGDWLLEAYGHSRSLFLGNGNSHGMCSVIHPQLIQVWWVSSPPFFFFFFFNFWSARWQLNPRRRESEQKQNELSVNKKQYRGLCVHVTFSHDTTVYLSREAKWSQYGCSECGELATLEGKWINQTDNPDDVTDSHIKTSTEQWLSILTLPVLYLNSGEEHRLKLECKQGGCRVRTAF